MTSVEVIRKYLQDAIAAETSFESQLRSSSHDGDDFEVQALFFGYAAETNRQIQRLTARLRELGDSSSEAKGVLAYSFSLAPKLAQATHSPEERLVQDLVMAFSVANGERAMYEALAVAARTAGDVATEKLALEIASEEASVAEKIWHFFPSRSKIAFNVATAGEMDPAVDTKMADDRIVDETIL